MGLGAEIGELMYSQDRSGGNSLRRSSTTQGCSANGRRRRFFNRTIYTEVGTLEQWRTKTNKKSQKKMFET